MILDSLLKADLTGGDGKEICFQGNICHILLHKNFLFLYFFFLLLLFIYLAHPANKTPFFFSLPSQFWEYVQHQQYHQVNSHSQSPAPQTRLSLMPPAPSPTSSTSQIGMSTNNTFRDPKLPATDHSAVASTPIPLPPTTARPRAGETITVTRP